MRGGQVVRHHTRVCLYDPVLKFPRSLMSREEAPIATPKSPSTSFHVPAATFLSLHTFSLKPLCVPDNKPVLDNQLGFPMGSHNDCVQTHHTLRSRTLSGKVTLAELPAASSSFSNPASQDSVSGLEIIDSHRGRANIVLDVPRNCFGGSLADVGNSCSRSDAIRCIRPSHHQHSKCHQLQIIGRSCTK